MKETHACADEKENNKEKRKGKTISTINTKSADINNCSYCIYFCLGWGVTIQPFDPTQRR